jgi:uncharacterized protein
MPRLTCETRFSWFAGNFNPGLRPSPIAYSTDGRSFTLEAPLDYPAPTGSYVVIEQLMVGHSSVKSSRSGSKSGRARNSGLIFERRPEFLLEGASIAQTTVRPRIELIAGHGVLLGKSVDSSLIATRSVDTFQSADFSPASANLINRYLESQRTEAASLEIGTATHGDPSSAVYLGAGGFARHTFLCGQSGSGKTYSLGVILERLLLESKLRMMIIDPNSDFVRLPELDPQPEHSLLQIRQSGSGNLGRRFACSVPAMTHRQPVGGAVW